MQVTDVMTTDVVTVRPETKIEDVAKTLLHRRISAVPVVDDEGRVIGIVSEGDLMHRPESGTERRASWWLEVLTLPSEDARRFVKAHGRHAADVMTTDVITAGEDATLNEIAELFERNHIKRVPITHEGRLVGIVSRADLLRGLATARRPLEAPSADDREIRKAVQKALEKHTGLDAIFVAVNVTDGVVHLWGSVEDPAHKDSARVAAENVPGVRSVEDRIKVFSPNESALLWI